ncbi:MAG: class I SAM-dependent methyltransferase [Polyangiales bacterium]
MVNGNAQQQQKKRAIDTHSDQAEEFSRRYQPGDRDPYDSCFTYSRKRLDAMLDTYLPRDPRGLRMLDVGCGTGHHMASMHQRGFEVAGVDGSPEMLAHARNNNPGADIRDSDVEHIPFDSGTFDVALSIEVLRYLPSPDACVAEMARVLKPGGLCLATALPMLNANGYLLVNRLASALPSAGLTPLRQFFTTESRLRESFERAGFRDVEIHGVYTGPINWIGRVVKPATLSRILHAWEPLDASIADRPLLRELANMFLVRAIRA